MVEISKIALLQLPPNLEANGKLGAEFNRGLEFDLCAVVAAAPITAFQLNAACTLLVSASSDGTLKLIEVTGGIMKDHSRNAVSAIPTTLQFLGPFLVGYKHNLPGRSTLFGTNPHGEDIALMVFFLSGGLWIKRWDCVTLGHHLHPVGADAPAGSEPHACHKPQWLHRKGCPVKLVTSEWMHRKWGGELPSDLAAFRWEGPEWGSRF